MPIPEPVFDSRNYRDILNDALSRIPVHNPEWTNLNDSDPGITLLQLFAFMTESIIYRANLIPERNRLKFLRLLGVPVQPAMAARGMVSFSLPRAEVTGPLEEGQELLAGRVNFRTLNGLEVLPIQAQPYFKKPLSRRRREEVQALYRRLYASFARDPQDLDFYETTAFVGPDSGVTLPVLDLSGPREGEDPNQPFDTIDGTVWLALLTRPRGQTVEQARQAIANRVLTLGILPALGEAGCTVHPREAPPTQERPGLIFEIPNADSNPPAYEPLPIRASYDPLVRPGVVELRLPAAERLRTWEALDPLEAGVGDYPPSLEETREQERLITWIRIRPQEPVRGRSTRQLSAQLSWIGINAAEVVQESLVPAEKLPDGTGEPDQTAVLVNTPVLAETLRLTVNGEIWSQIDDLGAAPPEVPSSPRLAAAVQVTGQAPPCQQLPVLGTQARRSGSRSPSDPRVYLLDPESGEIRFGDGARGMRPPRGAVIQASYHYGGGRQGLVGIGSINKGPALPPGLEVTNPIPTWGGDEAETVAQAERRIPALLRHRDRLISKQDFEEVTWQTPGVELGRVEVLPLTHPEAVLDDSEGVVTVLVIPRYDPEQPAAPKPDRLFLETICRYLEPRRVLTTELHVRGPQYENVWVSVGIDAVPGEEEGPLRERVRVAIQEFLSPLRGGFEGRGWALNKSVEAVEVLAAAARVRGVAGVNALVLGQDSGEAGARVEISGLQLPRLMAAVVQSGDPMPIDQVLGASPAAETARSVVPIPVIPEEC